MVRSNRWSVNHREYNKQTSVSSTLKLRNMETENITNKTGGAFKTAGRKTYNGISSAARGTWAGVKKAAPYVGKAAREAGKILREAAPGMLTAALVGGLLVVSAKNRS